MYGTVWQAGKRKLSHAYSRPTCRYRTSREVHADRTYGMLCGPARVSGCFGCLRAWHASFLWRALRKSARVPYGIVQAPCAACGMLSVVMRTHVFTDQYHEWIQTGACGRRGSVCGGSWPRAMVQICRRQCPPLSPLSPADGCVMGQPPGCSSVAIDMQPTWGSSWQW